MDGTSVSGSHSTNSQSLAEENMLDGWESSQVLNAVSPHKPCEYIHDIFDMFV